MDELVYTTLANRLRAGIRSGQLSPGSYLPTESTLMREQNVSRGTVRRAIDVLVREGLVISRQGRGHQVRQGTALVWIASQPERNQGRADGPSDTWSRSVLAQGFTPSEQITTEIGYASDAVARWLALAAREPVSIRRRLRFVDGAPYSIADSFYPRSIVAGSDVELPADVQPGVYAIFAALGRPWARTVDRLCSRAPTPEESATLAIPRGVAVAEVVRRSFDPAGIPVRLTLFVLPGDRHEIEYEHAEATT